MSITVRQFTMDELNIIRNADKPSDLDNEYLKIATTFINKKTFDEPEFSVYHDMSVLLKHNYVVSLPDTDMVEFKAPNDDMARWFVSQEYCVDMATIQIHEVTTHYRKIK